MFDFSEGDSRETGLRAGAVDRLVAECAGVCGIDPDPFKLRELLAMTESRERSEWGRLSNLMALVANAHRDPKRHSTVRPEAFNPYAGSGRYSELTRRKRAKAPLTVLRDVFCRKDSRREVIMTERIERPDDRR